jgi:uncharacterized cupredoxin-like copper-binding protein
MKRTILIAAVLLSILLTGCGRSQPTTTIDLNMTDFTCSPNQFVVPAGREITLDVVNSGAVLHNFILMKAGASHDHGFDEMDEKNIYWKIELAPGQSISTSFTSPAEPGDYLIVCSTPGHYQAGMTGTLVVVAE